MKILIFTAIHGRQEITELFLMGIERLKMHSKQDISLFCVVSDLADIEYLEQKGIEYCVAPNKPINEKLNYGFSQAIKKDFDYLLRLGSDDLLDHNALDLYYQHYMNLQIDYFGLKQIGVIDFNSLESIVYKYNIQRDDMLLGGGSMLSRKLCNKLKGVKLYGDKPLNNGLDNASEKVIKKLTKPVPLKSPAPVLIDIKSDVNIWKYSVVKKGQPRIDYDDLTHFLSKEEDRYLKIKKKELSCIAVIPVKGRLPLVKHTIDRLLNKNGCSKVICVVDNFEDYNVCHAAGAYVIFHENKPLGAKWNRGFEVAKSFNPDWCLFVGSSDWIGDNWLEFWEPYLLQGFDMMGTPDFKLLDYGRSLRLCHWAGYTDSRRKGEPIGIGRILSKNILDKLDWKPMDSALDSSLDYSMWQKVLNAGGKISTVRTEEIHSLSLSTHTWPNKHKFEDHFSNILPSTKIPAPEKFLTQHFPEALKL